MNMPNSNNNPEYDPEYDGEDDLENNLDYLFDYAPKQNPELEDAELLDIFESILGKKRAFFGQDIEYFEDIHEPIEEIFEKLNPENLIESTMNRLILRDVININPNEFSPYSKRLNQIINLQYQEPKCEAVLKCEGFVKSEDKYVEALSYFSNESELEDILEDNEEKKHKHKGIIYFKE